MDKNFFSRKDKLSDFDKILLIFWIIGFFAFLTFFVYLFSIDFSYKNIFLIVFGITLLMYVFSFLSMWKWMINRKKMYKKISEEKNVVKQEWKINISIPVDIEVLENIEKILFIVVMWLNLLVINMSQQFNSHAWKVFFIFFSVYGILIYFSALEIDHRYLLNNKKDKWKEEQK